MKRLKSNGAKVKLAAGLLALTTLLAGCTGGGEADQQGDLSGSFVE
ncbi:hypothetical protein [Paenibacillus sp. GCM10027626]